jgi:hypothetical protein
MKRILACAALAALTSGFVGTSQAIPIQIDFSGTTYEGVHASGQFVIETDGLVQLEFGGSATSPQKIFTDRIDLANRPTPILGSFSVGSDIHSLSDYLPAGYGSVQFVDLCAAECGPGVSDNWSVNLFQQSYAFGSVPPDGGYTYRAMGLFSGGYFESFDFLDNATTRPEDILTMPLIHLSAYFFEETVTCFAGECATTRNLNYQVNVDSLTRSVISTSVPEPGTLGLFGTVLGGMLLFRRRAALRSVPIC